MQLGNRYRIDQIVPHAGRMSLLDELVRYDAECVVAALTIRQDAQFFEAGRGVPAYVGIEYMAQAVSAYSGIEAVQAGGKPKIGLLLGSRRYRCSTDYFPLGARLEVVAHMELRDQSNLVVFTCKIIHDGDVVARADMKAVMPDDVHELIRLQTQASN